MIRIRNKDDFEVYLSSLSTQTTGKKLFFTVPFNCFLKAMYAKLGTAGITGTQTVDINDEGSSIFASGGIAFATTAVDPTYAALTTDPHVFTKGDRVDITVDGIHSGTAAIDLSVVLVFTRSKPAGTIAGAVEAGVGSGF